MAFLTAMALGAVIDIRTGASMASLSKLSAAFEGVRGKLAGVTTALGQSFSGLQSLSILSVGVTAGLAFMAKKAGDFEVAMARVAAKLDDKSQLPMLADQAKRLAMETQYSAEQVAGGQELMAQAGFNAQEIMSGLPGILAAAASDGLDLATATDIITSSLRGFGFQADQSGRVADVFAKASAATNVTMVEMGESMKYIAPLAQSLGMDFEELSAAVGLLANVGIKGSQAGTSLRGMMTHLTAPTKKAKTALADMGMTFQDLQDENGNLLPLNDIMLKLSGGMTKLGGSADRLGAMAHIFGVEAAPAVLALMDAAGKGDLSALTGQLKDATGAAQEMADILNRTTMAQLNRLWHSLEVIGIQAFETFDTTGADALVSFNEFIKEIYKGMRGESTGSFGGNVGVGIQAALDGINEAIEQAKPWVNWLMDGLAAAIGPERAVQLGMLVVGITLLTAALAPVVGVLTVVLAIAGGIAAVLSPLIELIGVGGVAAIAVFAAALAAMFGAGAAGGYTMSDQFGMMWFAFRIEMEAAYEAFMKWWPDIMAIFQPAVDNLLASWHEIMSAIGAGGSRSTTSLQDIGAALGHVAGFVAQVVAGMLFWFSVVVRIGAVMFRAVTEPLFNAFSRIGSAMVDFMSGTITFKEALISVFAGLEILLTTPIRAAINTILGLMATVIDNPMGRKLLQMAGIDPNSFIQSLSDTRSRVSSANGTEMLFGEREKVDHAKLLSGMMEDEKRKNAAATAANQVAADMAEKGVTISTTVPVVIDGREVARAVKKSETELSERAGFSQTPWQQRSVLERNATIVSNQ